MITQIGLIVEDHQGIATGVTIQGSIGGADTHRVNLHVQVQRLGNLVSVGSVFMFLGDFRNPGVFIHFPQVSHPESYRVERDKI